MGAARSRRLSGEIGHSVAPSQPRYWHYTASLEKIAESGQILPTAVGRLTTVRPAVWLSTNPQWERTVRKRLTGPGFGPTGKLLSRDGILKAGFQPARIEVSPELPFLTWQEYRAQSGDTTKEMDAMEWISREWGADPREWRILFSPVPRSEWKAVEVWDGLRWQRVGEL